MFMNSKVRPYRIQIKNLLSNKCKKYYDYYDLKMRLLSRSNALRNEHFFDIPK